MTKININSIRDLVQPLIPWELSLEIDGVSYATRPLDNLALGTLVRLTSDKSTTEEQLKCVIGGLFVDQVPVDGWDQDTLVCVLTAITTYHQERLSKKSLAAADAVRTAIARSVQANREAMAGNSIGTGSTSLS